MGKIIASMDEVAIGNVKNWSAAPASERAKAQRFEGAVPLDVAVAIVGWEPVSITVPSIVDDKTMEQYEMPDHLSQFVGRIRPDGTRKIINVAGSGYSTNLHNAMREATFLAADSELDITLAACNKDGAFLCLQMAARETVKFGNAGNGFVPLVTIMSSLTGKTKTIESTGSLQLFCTNQMRAFKLDIAKQIGLKRTRNAEASITPASFARQFEISFAATHELAAELERACNIEVTDAEMAKIMDLWKPLTNDDGTPLAEGRGRTVRENDRGTLTRLLHTDPRVGLGQTVGGLWQAHNTYQHWEMTARGNDNRISRMAERAPLSESDTLDAEFMQLVAQVKPEVSKALALV